MSGGPRAGAVEAAARPRPGAARAAARPPGPPAPRPRSVARLYFEALLSTLVIWLFGVTFLVQPVAVPTGSMLNTILVGDHALVNRSVYGTPAWLAPLLPYRELRRGDVVVFRHPTDPESLYVKRVVGLPGETVEVYGTRVYVDGRELPENKALVRDTSAESAMEVVGEARPAEGATYTVYYSQLRDRGAADDWVVATLASVDRGTFGVGKPFTLPAGQYFVLGDNRDNSMDSRFWGTVPRENVVGRAMFVYWSSDPSASGLLDRLRLNRVGTLIQ
jgi:signal peptidase I